MKKFAVKLFFFNALIINALYSFCQTPSTQVSSFVLTDITFNSVSLSWSLGSGTDVIVIARTPSVSAGPTDNVTYNANSVYGSGDAITVGFPTQYNYVVYKGSGTTLTVTGLNGGTTYEFYAFSFNGSGGSEAYLVSAEDNHTSQTTPPTTQASNITFPTVTGTSIRPSWSNGSGTGRIVVARETTTSAVDPENGTDYSANSSFGTGETTGTGNYVVYRGTGTTITGGVTGLTGSTNYTFKVYEFVGSGTTIVYKVVDGTNNPMPQSTLKPAPTGQAYNITAGNKDGATADISWSGGNGDGTVVYLNTINSFTAPTSGTSPSANPVYGGSGAQCVFNGSLGTFNVSGLSQNTTYYVRAYEFNNSGTNTLYHTTDTTLNPASFLSPFAEPTTQVSSILFTENVTGISYSWTDGSGDGRIVKINTINSFTNPADGTPETANSVYAGGEQVIYAGSGSSSSVTNLTANTTYFFKAYEYSNSDADIDYKTDGHVADNNPNSTSTLKSEPTLQASDVTFASIATTTFTTNWIRGGDGDGVIVLGKEGSAVSDNPVDGTIYTANAAFGSGTQIGSGNYVLFIGDGTTVDVTALAEGTNYHIRVYEYTNSGADIDFLVSSGTNNPGNTTTLAGEPTTQTSTITFSGIQTNQLTATASGGNGANRIILAKQGSPVNGTPVDGTEYTGTSSFGSGQQIGSGNYVVSAGSNTGVTVTNLSENTRYYFKVFEYNNTGSNTNYKTDGFSATNPLDTITIKSAPLLQASNIIFSNIASTTMDLNWTRGDGDSIMIVAKAGSTLTETPTAGTAYNPNPIFSSGDAIGGAYVVYTGTGTNVSISGLTASSEYTFKAFEYSNPEPFTSYLNSNGTNNPQSQFTVGAEPTTQASEIIFSNTQSNQVTLAWTNGNGTSRLILVHQAATVDANPVDGSAYSANTIYGTGDEVGTGNYVVYNSTGTSVTVTNLLPETTYHFRVFEYSGTGTATNYFTDAASNNPNSTTTLIGKPNLQASNIVYSALNSTSYTIDWTDGDGDGVIVVGKAAAALTAVPTDGVTYTPNLTFTSGEDIGDGNRVVYDGVGTGGPITVTGLSVGTEYTFKVFAYNTISTLPYYQDANATDNPLSRYTLATEPSAQATNITFTTVDATQIQFNYTTGTGGTSWLVLASTSAITSNPIDGTAYTANAAFGSGDLIGTDHYVVYNGSASPVTVTNLTPNTTYNFKVFEYSGSGTTSNYYTPNATGNPASQATIKGEPSTQASELTFTALATTTYTANWIRGDGDGIIVVARQGAAVEDLPADGNTSFTANAAYGTPAAALGTGYVVFSGTSGTSVDLTNLSVGTEYHLRAFEYNNSGTDTDYLTSSSSNNPNSQSTLDSEPSSQVTGFGVAGTGTNSITLSWNDDGDGSGRIILARQANAVNSTPVDGTAYAANSVFGSGDLIGTENYVVYAGTGATGVTVTGLLGQTFYHFQIFEYNNTGATNYLTTSAPITNSQTGAKIAPTVQASSINFSNLATTSLTINWTNGDGEKRIVAFKEATTGSPTPANNTTYAASTDWSVKTGLISDGFYTVYNGVDETVTVTNLSPNTTYRVQVFEYNNPAGTEQYLTTTATENPANQVTLKLAPTKQAADISLVNQYSNSLEINWTNGNGDNRICVINTASSFSDYDGTDPTANTVYSGAGEQVIYNGTSNTVSITSLAASTAYYFKVYEYNNSGTGTLFHSLTDTTGNPGSFSTLGTATWNGTTTDWNTGTNWNPTTTPTSAQSVIIAAGESAYPVITTSETVDNMNIEAEAYITISDGGSLTVTNSILLENSGSTAPSGMVVIPGTGTLSASTSTMELYHPADSIHFVSFPTTSPSMSVFTGNFAVKEYDEPNANFVNMFLSDPVSTRHGYAANVRTANRILSFSGTFNNNLGTISVTNSSPGDGNYGWNLVGNPYPSTIDWNAASGWTKTNVDNTAYYYNGSNGTYASFNGSTGSNGGTRYIAPGQGFFIHASANGTFGMANAVRVSNQQSFWKKATTTIPLIRLQATNTVTSTDIAIVFMDEATENFDTEFDAYKWYATNLKVADLYTLLSDETPLSINALNSSVVTELETQNYSIPLGFTKGADGNITIEASEIENISESIFIYLYDNLENKHINLRKNSYNFYINSKTDDRFTIILSKTALGIENNETFTPDFNIYTNKNKAFVKSEAFLFSPGEIHLVGITGKVIKSVSTKTARQQEITIEKPGIYIIKVIINNRVITQKVVVQ